MLRKNRTRQIIRENGIRFSKEPFNHLDSIIEQDIKDIITRTANILRKQGRQTITIDSINQGMEQHNQSHVAIITEKLTAKIKALIEKEGDEIAKQYRSGTQLNH